MKIESFQVKKFRNIVDSGQIKVDDSVTALVGKNEAGKSAILEALYLFNPAYGEIFDVEDQYPRWLVVRDRKAGDLKDHTPISVTFSLDTDDKASVSEVFGDGVITGHNLTIDCKYGGSTIWSFKWNEKAAIKNLLNKFPKVIVTLLKDVDSFEEVQ